MVEEIDHKGQATFPSHQPELIHFQDWKEPKR